MAMYDSPYEPYPSRRRQPATPWWTFVLLLLVIALVSGGLAWWLWPRNHSGLDASATPRPVTPPSGDVMSDEQMQIKVYKDARKSVVHIMSLNEREATQATGSGFVWDDEGHVVTNFHVVQDAAAAVVILDDHSSWRAKLVGAAPDKDLAVLYIAAPKSRLTPIPVGSSHDLQVGQNAFAIGNPYGLDQSFTKGVVSALGREIESATRRPIKDVIQTDAAVNPGNSGGPLLDRDARLIGVTTAIYSPSGANAGIGFAIPVDEVNRVVPQLIRSGKITRPGLGVVPAPDELARRFGVTEGALIWKVSPGGAAAKVGLRPTRRDEDTGEIQVGDVIVAIDDKPVHAGKDLATVFEPYKIGDTVSVTFLRDGQRQEVKATLVDVS